ncbi:hypothetical protein [Persicobacter diffluens]|uniref:Uncharacterized protein n=1 Tax=Persicobacter diffluens TaxID=981 RepID=A0AAN5AIL2_9BACT|nr:hypothetical protein PEDI_11170 [Persicobacter diffluens]
MNKIRIINKNKLPLLRTFVGLLKRNENHMSKTNPLTKPDTPHAKSKTITLIDSDYQSLEAEEVIHDLILSKIKFLRQKQFSNMERFGHKSAHLSQRASQLQQELNELQQLLDCQNNPEQVLTIQCEIKISVN